MDIALTSTHDAASITAYRVDARGPRRGGVVVVQEIFGVSDHIRERCDAFAAAGYDAIAPSLFDRLEPGFAAGLDPAGFERGRAAVAATPWPQVVADVQAAIDALAAPVFITGFCYGGAVAWLAAARCTGLVAASCFYGRLINNLLGDAPRVPTILHYGRADPSIPLADIDLVRARCPEVGVHLYDAGHGFCRAGSPDYAPDACALATARTLAHFAGPA